MTYDSGSARGGLVWREALRFGLPPAVLAVLVLFLGFPVAAGLLILLAVGVTAFFRDPARRADLTAESIVAPADGRVVEIRSEPGLAGSNTLSIFLSLFDVHVNRSPVSGRIVEVRSRRGKYRPAFSPRAVAENHQTEMDIATDRGPVRLRQIAGVVARRVVCWKRRGEPVARGERVGLIRFGSRVEVVLPAAARICVRPGDRVRAGETVVGRFGPQTDREAEAADD